MACSVYGGQYLLEALFKGGHDQYAIQLMTAHTERSWWHMIELGSTMTLEAWDAKVKGNLTWNHAWGAAPANIISRFVLGVRPLEPGYKIILIAPKLGELKWARGQVPTPLVPATLNATNGDIFKVDINIPASLKSTHRTSSPCRRKSYARRQANATAENKIFYLDLESGKHVIESR